MMHSARFTRGWLIVALLCLMIGVGQVSAQPQQQQTQAVATTDQTISIRLPAGWQFRTVGSLQYSSLLAFGDTGDSLQSMVASLTGGSATPITQGSNGVIGILSPALYTGLNMDVAVEGIFQLVTGPQTGLRVVQQQNQTFGGGQYQGQLAVVTSPTGNASGYVAVFTDGSNIIVAILGFAPSTNFDANVQAQLSAMLQSIQVPAEPNAITIPAQQATPVPALPTTAPVNPPAATAVPLPTLAPSTGGETTLVRAGDNTLSLELPANWVFEDHLADAKTFAYGSTTAAAEARLASVQPSLGSPGPITGSGGVVILYSPSDLGLGDSYDGGELMNRALANEQNQGFRVQGDVQLLQLEQGPLLYAVVLGPENGYLALAFLNGQIAYITGTGDAQSWAADQNVLFAILASLHVPAVSEQGGGGLGNPFGNAATATPSSGLGLPLATVNPAPTAAPGQTATPQQGGGHIVPILPTPTT